MPSRNLPVVFTKDEASAIIAQLKADNKLIVSLLYGSGLRIMEAVRLRVKDVDFGRAEITVRDGKGEKDRVTMLAKSLFVPLQAQIENVKQLHAHDLKKGYGRVLALRLGSKIPKCGSRLDLAVSVPRAQHLGRPTNPDIETT